MPRFGGLLYIKTVTRGEENLRIPSTYGIEILQFRRDVDFAEISPFFNFIFLIFFFFLLLNDDYRFVCFLPPPSPSPFLTQFVYKSIGFHIYYQKPERNSRDIFFFILLFYFFFFVIFFYFIPVMPGHSTG